MIREENMRVIARPATPGSCLIPSLGEPWGQSLRGSTGKSSAPWERQGGGDPEATHLRRPWGASSPCPGRPDPAALQHRAP